MVREAILHLWEKRALSRDEIGEAIRGTPRTAANYVQEMVKQGRLGPEGEPTVAAFRLTGSVLDNRTPVCENDRVPPPSNDNEPRP